jgi:hypothetical protein
MWHQWGLPLLLPAGSSLLLQLSPQAVADFERALMSTHVEKDQRGVIKQLVVQAGGEEVRLGTAWSSCVLEQMTCRNPGKLLCTVQNCTLL